VRKECAAYDLPLAMGILTGSEPIKEDCIKNYIIMGELSLDVSVQSIKGALPITIKALEDGLKGIFTERQY
tara:strand:- start:468 stop:680 length:213 start_codon:yes stop_codon:yes gene_type:complete